MSRRKGNGGSEIGLARLYDFKAQSGSFVNARLLNMRFVYLMLKHLLISKSELLSHLCQPQIEFKVSRSGATGYVVSAVTNATDFKLVDVSGKFLKNESILINGIQDGRLITKVDTFGFSDVASLESAVGVSTFSADVVLDKGEKLTNIISGNFQLKCCCIQETHTSLGVGNGGVIKAAGKNFAGIITSNNIVSYTSSWRNHSSF